MCLRILRQGCVRPTSSTKMRTRTHLSSGGKDSCQSYETPYVTLSHKIPNRNKETGNKKVKVLRTNTNSISLNSDKSHHTM
jgi:hypothetical protein